MDKKTERKFLIPCLVFGMLFLAHPVFADSISNVPKIGIAIAKFLMSIGTVVFFVHSYFSNNKTRILMLSTLLVAFFAIIIVFL